MEQRAVLPVIGMTCANCVATIEKGLKKLDGVESVSVNLGTEKADVRYDSNKLQTADLIKRVQLVGYDVPTTTINLAITGMTCANCVTTIEKGLKKLEGVVDATVNLGTERAHVTVVPRQLTRRDLVKQVEKIGYGVVEQATEDLSEDAERAARTAEVHRQQHLLLIGTIFSLPLFLLSMARDFSLLGEWAMSPWVNVVMWV